MGAAPLDHYPAPVHRTTGGPTVHLTHIELRVPDPDRRLAGVTLAQEVARPRLAPEFVRFPGDDGWTLLFPRPDADRMEYQLQLVHDDGAAELVCDPLNELRAPGPFGDKSVLEFPEYQRPAWLDQPASHPGQTRGSTIPSRAVRTRIRVDVWTPHGHDPHAHLPLLVAHDGPEFAEYSGLTALLAHAIEDERLPPMRAALLAPVERDQTYSASASYARALAHDILPALARLAPTPHGRAMRVGMGASLGALAMLHAHRSNPAAFGGLFLQSGSYFRHRFDKHEAGFVRFGRINRFVGRVLTAPDWPHPIPVTITCGTAEENLFNNRAVAHALAAQGYDVTMVENRDAHNWIAWRDTFDPHLVELLAKMWS